ncbi:MAG TPA: DUF309 domain-containing protein [Verrucomicrobiae bacterium]|nr:DUF309 domain-containing protein [Verrucomicrobiae bacterium]
MSKDPFSDAYRRGIELFNRGEYFDAHEVWEDPWRGTQGDDRLFYQGLIQAAVALEHLCRGNRRSAATVWRNCRPKLVALPVHFMGMDLRSFVAAMEVALQPALAPGAGAAAFDRSSAPIIRIDSSHQGPQ